MPSSTVWIFGNQLYARVTQGTVCNQHIVTFGNLTPYACGAT